MLSAEEITNTVKSSHPNFTNIIDKDVWFTCTICNKGFKCPIKIVRYSIKIGRTYGKYCSRQCQNISKITKIESVCIVCTKPVIRVANQAKRSKSGYVFCSHSCSAKYSNSHKTTGTRRSKLEEWLERQITISYPQIKILYNKLNTNIGYELDIFIPHINMAFEINGIIHYKPIYGIDKLAKTQHIDTMKENNCLKNNIDLIVINVADQKRFTVESSSKYLEFICSKINERSLIFNRIGRSEGS